MTMQKILFLHLLLNSSAVIFWKFADSVLDNNGEGEKVHGITSHQTSHSASWVTSHWTPLVMSHPNLNMSSHPTSYHNQLEAHLKHVWILNLTHVDEEGGGGSGRSNVRILGARIPFGVSKHFVLSPLLPLIPWPKTRECFRKTPKQLYLVKRLCPRNKEVLYLSWDSNDVIKLYSTLISACARGVPSSTCLQMCRPDHSSSIWVEIFGHFPLTSEESKS